jgi:hypothetical protein
MPVNYQSQAPLFFVPRLDLAPAQMEDSFLKAIIDALKGATKATTYRKRILYYLLKADVLNQCVFREVPLTETLLLVIPKTLICFCATRGSRREYGRTSWYLKYVPENSWTILVAWLSEGCYPACLVM